MLLMKKRFFDAIRSGRKTTTVRLWRHARLAAGQVHTIPGLGKVRIERVEPVEPEDLTEDLARSDGFERLCDMTAALKEMYGDLSCADGRRLFVVRFAFIRPTGQ
jgi:hypothetical protein